MGTTFLIRPTNMKIGLCTAVNTLFKRFDFVISSMHAERRVVSLFFNYLVFANSSPRNYERTPDGKWEKPKCQSTNRTWTLAFTCQIRTTHYFCTVKFFNFKYFIFIFVFILCYFLAVSVCVLIVMQGIRLEILNESLIACKGVEGTISPIEGWTEESIAVHSPQITLPDLEVFLLAIWSLFRNCLKKIIFHILEFYRPNHVPTISFMVNPRT